MHTADLPKVIYCSVKTTVADLNDALTLAKALQNRQSRTQQASALYYRLSKH